MVKGVPASVTAKLAGLDPVTGVPIASITVLFASQYPTADVLGSQIRQQVLRISGRLDDEVASRTVLGVSGAEKIPASTPGRFLCQEGGKLTEFQAFRPSF